jgi:DNA-binding beta-propeller fold protein YncE
MMRKLLLLLAAALPAAPAAAAVPTRHHVVTGAIAGPDGGWDLASIDPAGHRLLIARAAEVTVVDLVSPPQVRAIGHVVRGHAAIALPHGRVLVTSGTEGKARILDAATGTDLVDATVGQNPDAAIWDARISAALVMNARSGSISVVDPSSGAVIRTIALAPGLELPALDENGLLYVNNEDANLIHVVDPSTGAVRGPIPLTGCEGPTGLGYDPRTHLLIAACANGKAAVVDTVAGRVTQLLDIDRGPDTVMIDSARGLAFIPCGRDGELDVIALARGRPLAVTERVRTEIGARTGAVDPATGIVYLPTARFGPAPAAGGRAPALPGTFHIVVVGSR